jgi:hyperosmotically inducible periplasmic protein
VKRLFATTCVLFYTLLPAVVVAQDSERSHPAAFVKDSAITMTIQAKLAAAHITSWGRMHVDTDKNGVVWLTGSARTREAAEEAESMARETERVKAVHSEIKIKKDDSTDATPPPAPQGQRPQSGDRGVEDKGETPNRKVQQAAGLLLALGLLSGAGVAPR